MALPVVSGMGLWGAVGGWIVAAGTENPVLRARKYLLFCLFSAKVIYILYRERIIYIYMYTYCIYAKHRCFIVNHPKQTDFHFSRAALKNLPPSPKTKHPPPYINRYRGLTISGWSTDDRSYIIYNIPTYNVISQFEYNIEVVSPVCSLRVFVTMNMKI